MINGPAQGKPAPPAPTGAPWGARLGRFALSGGRGPNAGDAPLTPQEEERLRALYAEAFGTEAPPAGKVLMDIGPLALAPGRKSRYP